MRSRGLSVAPVVVFLCVGIASVCRVSAGPAAPSPKLAPDFTLTESIKSDTLRLAELNTQPVLLFFYDGAEMASMGAFPYVNEWHRRYESDGLRIIGVHSPALEQMKIRYNAVEVISRARVTFPIGMDYDRAVYAAYSLSALPAYVLMKPGREIVYETTQPLAYAEIETAIQRLLAERKPGIVNPFIVKPFRPIDDPGRKVLPATPQINLGYGSGAIADCDSTAYDRFYNFSDSREHVRGKIYLQGYWKVGPNSVAYEEKYRSSEDHLRVAYSGKEVWLLPCFPYGGAQRVYVKQDREYLRNADWGKDIQGDSLGKPFIYMQYSIPVNIVKNRAFGAHELEIIPAEGDVAFYYLFFVGDVAE
jgi:peroxiredoxin